MAGHITHEDIAEIHEQRKRIFVRQSLERLRGPGDFVTKCNESADLMEKATDCQIQANDVREIDKMRPCLKYRFSTCDVAIPDPRSSFR